MINNNELRIGNYIRNKYTKEIFCVTEILKDNFVSFSNNRTSHTKGISLFEPIPLTEEILLKTKVRFSKLDLIESYEESCYHAYYGEDKNNPIKLEYLHELQNTYYFTHNKTELEINGL